MARVGSLEFSIFNESNWLEFSKKPSFSESCDLKTAHSVSGLVFEIGDGCTTIETVQF
jgi:hypothetical protein